MRARTKPFGEIEVSEKQRLEIPDGLFGFEELKSYVILDASQQPFYWLQSLDRPSVAFVLLDPRVFMSDYRLDVAEEDLEALGVRSPEEVLDFVIVTVPGDPRDMTANLQGPLVVNRKTRAARQCISRNPDYSVKHRIMDSLAARRR
jgi:flagellar assembly factor FliW